MSNQFTTKKGLEKGFMASGPTFHKVVLGLEIGHLKPFYFPVLFFCGGEVLGRSLY
jgi:hypothetical protein